MTTELVAEELWNLRPVSETGHAVGRMQSLDRAGQPLTAELADELAARGFRVRQRHAEADLALHRAGVLIQCLPSLERVVLECVRDVLILDAPDEWHDVSHSEPRWPHLIFVSLPTQTPVGDLRLAEAIVHEAMHLNLSLVESHTQLVGEEGQLFSPWRLRPRPAGGVLHGVYVFASLLRFLGRLQQEDGLSSEQREHLARRCTDILRECSEVPRQELLDSLTGAGRAIAQRIFEYVDRQAIV